LIRRIILLLLVLLTFASSVTTQADIFIVDTNGDADYDSIRDAVRAADNGDTIEVHSGAYNESINVNKTLVLKGIDTGGGKPAINSEGIFGDTIVLNADGIVLNGFDFKGSYNNRDTRYAGIKVISDDNTIIYNSIRDNYKGIEFHRGKNNIIRYNNISNNNYGLWIFRSENNTMSDNNVSENLNNGFFIKSSQLNNITHNDINNNRRTGIKLENAPRNRIINNNISYHSEVGISVDDYSCSDNDKSVIDEYKSSNSFKNNKQGDVKTGSGISYTPLEDE